MPPDATALNRTLAAAGVEGAELTEQPFGLLVSVPAGRVRDALTALAGEAAGFNFLVDMFGSDTGEAIELTYHLRSLGRDEELFVRCAAPYDSDVPSVWSAYPAALYAEREAAEMFGVAFAGHPNPKRLLTSDETQPFPLRKASPIRSSAELARPGIRREATGAAEEAQP